MKKRILFLVLFIIVIIVSILSYRYIKYHDFFGKFYDIEEGYIQFNFLTWESHSDNSGEVKCSLWGCNVTHGRFYYVKDSTLYRRLDSEGIIYEKFKLEKKDNILYLYIYNSNNEIVETYIKK